MLNPDTISDSPSAKSKGVRLDSAMHSITHEVKQGYTEYCEPQTWLHCFYTYRIKIFCGVQ